MRASIRDRLAFWAESVPALRRLVLRFEGAWVIDGVTRARLMNRINGHMVYEDWPR